MHGCLSSRHTVYGGFFLVLGRVEGSCCGQMITHASTGAGRGPNIISMSRWCEASVLQHRYCTLKVLLQKPWISARHKAQAALLCCFMLPHRMQCVSLLFVWLPGSLCCAAVWLCMTVPSRTQHGLKKRCVCDAAVSLLGRSTLQLGVSTGCSMVGLACGCSVAAWSGCSSMTCCLKPGFA